MKLRADKIDDYLKDQKRLRWTFNAASAAKMRALGHAFAHVVRDLLEQSTKRKTQLRVGIAGAPDIGKSTFVRAILEEFNGKASVERKGGQHTWECPRLGFIRHYDAAYTNDFDRLPSYIHNDQVGCFGRQLVDIVEHPAEDMHNTKFDYLVVMKEEGAKGNRRVTVLPATGQEKSDGFWKFLHEARPLRHS